MTEVIYPNSVLDGVVAFVGDEVDDEILDDSDNESEASYSDEVRAALDTEERLQEAIRLESRDCSLVHLESLRREEIHMVGSLTRGATFDSDENEVVFVNRPGKEFD